MTSTPASAPTSAAAPAPAAAAAVAQPVRLLDNKAAVITGGAGRRGIGFAAVRMFARHGARCAILDLESANPQQAAEDIARECGGQHVGVAFDARDGDSCQAAVNAAAAALGGLDILVNNAGFSQSLQAADIGDGDFDAIVNIHLRAALKTAQAALPHFRAAAGGSIVNLSSISAIRGGGIFGGAHYSAAKAGVIGLTRALAREWAPHNIRVNAVAPSLIETNIFAGQMPPERLADIAAAVPMGRLGQPDDVAGVLLFLASGLAGYVTGEVIQITGGSHIG